MIHATSRDSRLAKPFHSTGSPWVGIPGSDDDFPDACIDERIDAGRRLSMMVARFECHMDDGVASGCTGLGNGKDFRVWLAESLMMSGCQNRSGVIADDTADHRIGFHMAMASGSRSNCQIQ